MLGRLKHLVQAKAWDTWRQRAVKQRRLAWVAGSAVRRMLKRVQALALGRWKESTAEQCRLRQVREKERVC
jgi:hypothetical protein